MSIENVLFRCGGGDAGASSAAAYLHIQTTPNSLITAIGQNTGKRAKGTSNTTGEAVVLLPALDTYSVIVADTAGHVSDTATATISVQGESVDLQVGAIITINTDGGAVVTAVGTNTGDTYTATATYVSAAEGLAIMTVLKVDEYSFTSHAEIGDSPQPVALNVTGFTDYTIQIQAIKIVTWADGTNEEIAAMLDAYRAGRLDIQDYWHIGDVRPISMPQMPSVTMSSDNVGPFAAHNNGLKISNFGDTKNIVSGSDKAIICTFSRATPTQSSTTGTTVVSANVRNYYNLYVLTAVQTAIGTLASYLRSFTKYYSSVRSNGYYSRGYVSNWKCAGLSVFDIFTPEQGESAMQQYIDPLPIFSNGKAPYGSIVYSMDCSGPTSTWLSYIDVSGNPKYHNYLEGYKYPALVGVVVF